MKNFLSQFQRLQNVLICFSPSDEHGIDPSGSYGVNMMTKIIMMMKMSMTNVTNVMTQSCRAPPTSSLRGSTFTTTRPLAANTSPGQVSSVYNDEMVIFHNFYDGKVMISYHGDNYQGSPCRPGARNDGLCQERTLRPGLPTIAMMINGNDHN